MRVEPPRRRGRPRARVRARSGEVLRHHPVPLPRVPERLRANPLRLLGRFPLRRRRRRRDDDRRVGGGGGGGAFSRASVRAPRDVRHGPDPEGLERSPGRDARRRRELLERPVRGRGGETPRDARPRRRDYARSRPPTSLRRRRRRSLQHHPGHRVRSEPTGGRVRRVRGPGRGSWPGSRRDARDGSAARRPSRRGGVGRVRVEPAVRGGEADAKTETPVPVAVPEADAHRKGDRGREGAERRGDRGGEPNRGVFSRGRRVFFGL